MLIGALAAIAGGVATPVSFLFFGDVISAFTFYTLTNSVSSSFNVSLSCDLNKSSLATIIAQNFSTTENALSCVDEERLVFVVNQSVYSFVGLSLGTFLVSLVQIFFYQTACERQLYKIRIYYYRAILRQDIGWFDSNPSGELASRLSELESLLFGFFFFPSFTWSLGHVMLIT